MRTRVYCLMVFTLLTLTCCRTAHREDGPPPDQATKTLNGTVTDSSGAPIAGAWVVVADVFDSNGDDSFFAASTFTDNQGNYSIPIDGSEPWLWVSATANDTVTWLGRTRTVQGDNQEDIVLEQSQGDTVVFWGSLAGADTSGARIGTNNTMPDPLTVANNQGLFCACVRRDDAVTVAAWNLKGQTSFLIQEGASRTPATAWTQPMTTGGLANISGSVFLDHPGGAVPAPGGTQIEGWALDSGGRVIDLVHALASNTGNGSFVTPQTHPVGQPYTLIAKDGSGRWGRVDIGSADDLAAIVLPEATASLTVQVETPARRVNGAPGGRVDLYLLVDGQPAVLEEKIASRTTTASSIVSFDVPPGDYCAVFDDGCGGNFRSSPAKVSATDSQVDVSIPAGYFAPPELTNRVAGMTVPGSISGSLVFAGFSLQRLAISLINARTQEIVGDATVSPGAGTYSFADVAPGLYRLRAVGETLTGKRVFQADGPEWVLVEDGQNVNRQLRLHTAKCAVVVCFKVAQLNPLKPQEYTTVGVVAGATVELLDSSGAVVQSGTAGVDGICVFENLQDQVYRVRVNKSGYDFPSHTVSMDVSTIPEVWKVRAYGAASQ